MRSRAATPQLPSSIPVVPVVAALRRARAGDLMAPAEVADSQVRRLRRLLSHAASAVPHYRGSLDPAAADGLRAADDLAALLPVLDRAEVARWGPDHFTADGFDSANTHQASTSGSSGMPVTLRYSEGDMGYLRATFLWDLIASGMRPWDRVGYFRVGAFRRHRLEKLGVAGNVHIDTTTPVQAQGEAFLRGRPTFLYGYPGAISTLVDRMRRRGIDYRGVRGILFAGEPIPDAARADLLARLGARGHEAYASVEAYTIARSCRRGALHLRSADVLAEVEVSPGQTYVADHTLPTSGVEGELVVTRLVAEAMPLLRYRLGDRVAIGPDDCGCGARRTPIVHEVRGRTADRIVTRTGAVRSADFLFGLAKGVEGLRQLQFVQREPGVVELRVVAAQGADPMALEQRVRAALQRAEADVQVVIRQVPAVEPGHNGKIRIVRSLIR